MALKDQVLYALLANVEQPVSGEEIGRKLGITRVMVHKYIESLRRDGYDIQTVSGKGYRINWPVGELNPARVSQLVHGSWGRNLIWLPEVESTHDYLYHLMREKSVNCGEVVVARRQTGGHGRRGRSFVSPPGGLWFSLYLRTDLPIIDIPKLSLLVSLAAVRVLERFIPDISIKWPNDIMAGNRKLGGVLISLAGETDEIRDVIVSIGLNVNNRGQDLPGALKEQAVSLRDLTGDVVPIDELFADLLSELENVYTGFREGGWRNLLAEYRQKCRHIGKRISVHRGDDLIRGTNIGIGDDGSLLLSQDGETVVVFSGDVVEEF